MKKLIAALSIVLTLNSYGQSIEENFQAVKVNTKEYLRQRFESEPVRLNDKEFKAKLDSIDTNGILAYKFIITSWTGNFIQDEQDVIYPEDCFECNEYAIDNQLQSKEEITKINVTPKGKESDFIYYKLEIIEDDTYEWMTSSKLAYKLTILQGTKYDFIEEFH